MGHPCSPGHTPPPSSAPSLPPSHGHHPPIKSILPSPLRHPLLESQKSWTERSLSFRGPGGGGAHLVALALCLPLLLSLTRPTRSPPGAPPSGCSRLSVYLRMCKGLCLSVSSWLPLPLSLEIHGYPCFDLPLLAHRFPPGFSHAPLPLCVHASLPPSVSGCASLTGSLSLPSLCPSVLIPGCLWQSVPTPMCLLSLSLAVSLSLRIQLCLRFSLLGSRHLCPSPSPCSHNQPPSRWHHALTPPFPALLCPQRPQPAGAAGHQVHPHQAQPL